MPTKTWEPPPPQPNTDARPHQPESAEPGNFETAHGEGGWNPDASTVPERGAVDDEDINTHGSER